MSLQLALRLLADASGLAQGLQQGEKAVEGWTGGVRDRLNTTSRQLGSIGRQVSMRMSAPIAGFGALTLHAAGQFEEGMNRVAAVSGATGDQLEALRDQAKELGRTTQFSASQAADAMGFLAMAGFEATQILDAMPGTLQLAAAAQMDLGRTADVVSNILTGYRMEVEDLSRANDALVTVMTRTNTDLAQLGEAMKFAGPLASAAGVAFEETAAAIGLMGNAGIQGTMAGTALRGALTRILNPTNAAARAMANAGLEFTDAEGRVLGLTEIVRQLEPHADDAGLMMELFGQRAGPAMAALVSQGAGALADLTAELHESGGTAAAIASVQMQGFNGAVRELRSAFEGLQIAIADAGLLQFAADATRRLTSFLQSLSETNPELLKLAVIIGGGAAVAGPVLLALSALTAGLAALLSPIGLVVVAIAGLTAAWIAWGDDIQEAIGSALDWLTGRFETFTAAIGAVTERIAGAWSWLSETLVGNSIIPDMWESIEEWFARGGEAVGRTTRAMAQDTVAGFAAMGRGAIAEMQRLTAGVSRENKALFAINKMAAIANAVLNTHQGITRTLATYPWPLAGALAALHGAVGFAQVASIRSTGFGGGGSGPGVAAAGGGGVAAAAALPTAAAAPAPAPERQVVNITFGSRRSRFTREEVEEILDGINDLLGDNAVIRVGV